MLSLCSCSRRTISEHSGVV